MNMCSETAKILLDFLRLAPPYLITVSICCAILLFSPQWVLEPLRVFRFTQEHGDWLGLGLIGSSVLFAVDRIIVIPRWIRNRKAAAELKKMQADEKKDGW